jgi:hypothetical protein
MSYIKKFYESNNIPNGRYPTSYYKEEIDDILVELEDAGVGLSSQVYSPFLNDRFHDLKFEITISPFKKNWFNSAVNFGSLDDYLKSLSHNKIIYDRIMNIVNRLSVKYKVDSIEIDKEITISGSINSSKSDL